MNNQYVYIKPQECIYDIAKNIQTPAVLYDINQLKNAIKEIKRDIRHLYHASLNFALKSCYNRDVLRVLVENDLGCDVAGVNEYKIAKSAGFAKITTTAPAYKKADMEFFLNERIIMDFDSIEQIEDYGEVFPNTEIGIRLLVNFPKQFDNQGSFGYNSRFGIHIKDSRLNDLLKKYNLKVVHLHVHTGQMTTESLEYKIKYLLTIAEYLKDVREIDLGGGLFYLYIDRNKLLQSYSSISQYIKEWESNNREIHFIFEPGGAIVTPCGYLVTSVVNEKRDTAYAYRIITVDSSAWNMAPWHNSVAFNLNRTGYDLKKECEKTIIAGSTLYELDFYGGRAEKPYSIFELGEIQKGDKLIISMFGGYTYTNLRRFNSLDCPKEYIIEDGVCKECRD